MPDTEVQEGQRSYIFFNAEVSQLSVSKAGLLLDNSLPSDANTAFGVFGYCDGSSLFFAYTNPKDIAQVYRESVDGDFKYNKLAPWRGAEDDHTFYAFYPYSLYDKVTVSTSPYLSYTHPDGNVFEDILVASKMLTKASSVDLEFTHALWALDVEVKNSQTKDSPYDDDQTVDNLTVSSVELTLTGQPVKGNIPLSNPKDVTIIETGDKTYKLFESSSLSTDKVLAGNGGSFSCDPLLLMAVGNITYSIEIGFKNANGVAYTYEKSATITKSFEPGHRYKLLVEKEDATGTFSVKWSVSNWDATVTVPHTFN